MLLRYYAMIAFARVSIYEEARVSDEAVANQDLLSESCPPSLFLLGTMDAKQPNLAITAQGVWQ